MEQWGTQFHDAHAEYSDFVKDSLNKLYEKLKAQHDIWCPEAKKKEQKPDEKAPIYVLTMRLHTISRRMKKMLVFPTTNWKKNIYTSRFVVQYMDNKPHITEHKESLTGENNVLFIGQNQPPTTLD